MPENSQITPVWNDERLNEDILAFARLLTIRKDGQISPDDLKEVEEGEPEQPSSSFNSVSNDDEDQSWLKEYFCDRFAEFVAKKNHGRLVTSSAVHDDGEHAKIIIARNSGITRADQKSLRRFENQWHECAKSTEDICPGEKTLTCWDELWDLMVDFFYPWQIDFKTHNIFEGLIYTQAATTESKKKEMVSFRYLNQPRKKFRLHLKEKRSHKARIISAAYFLKNDQEFMFHLEQSLGENSRYEKIKQQIQDLAKLQTIYTTFVRVIFQLPKFRYPKIVFVPKPEKQPLCLPVFLEAIRIAGIREDSATRQLKPNSSLTDISSKYAGLSSRGLRQRRYVHAEVQLVLYYLQNPDLGRISYMVCSKLNCFMCFTFLDHLKIKSAGCRYQLYNGWAIPKISGDSNRLSQFCSALFSLRAAMILELNKPYTDPESEPHRRIRQSPILSLLGPTNNPPTIRDAESFAYEVPERWMLCENIRAYF